jgi:hypothetical protein
MLICLLPVFLFWSLVSPLSGWRRVVLVGGIVVLWGGMVWLLVWLFR